LTVVLGAVVAATMLRVFRRAKKGGVRASFRMEERKRQGCPAPCLFV
jgi:hypothetical protein